MSMRACMTFVAGPEVTVDTSLSCRAVSAATLTLANKSAALRRGATRVRAGRLCTLQHATDGAGCHRWPAGQRLGFSCFCLSADTSLVVTPLMCSRPLGSVCPFLSKMWCCSARCSDSRFRMVLQNLFSPLEAARAVCQRRRSRVLCAASPAIAATDSSAAGDASCVSALAALWPSGRRWRACVAVLRRWQALSDAVLS